MKMIKLKINIFNMLKIIVFALLFVDVDLPVVESNTPTIQAGFNGKYIQKGWKYLKGCVKLGDDIPGNAEKYTRKSIDDVLGMRKSIAAVNLSSDIGKIFDDAVNSVDDILPQINENLSKSASETHSSPKIIQCLKQDAGQTKMALYENNILKLNKTIKSSSKIIYLDEYDVSQMEEFSYIGDDGLEWVVFKIPRKAEYLLDGEFEGRVFECMVFNLPKDSSGRWEQLRAFIIDLFTRPGQLWDEYLFYHELEKLSISKQEVKELHEYMFALINGIDYENIKEPIFKETIA